MANKKLTTLDIKVDLDHKGAVVGLKTLKGGIKDVGVQSNTTGTKLTALKGKFTLLATAVTSVVVAMTKSLKLGAEQEQVEKKLAFALGKSTDALKRQAVELERITRFGDEATISQMSFLASLNFTEKQISEIIPVAMDLAEATGQTLEFGVRNLAKTFSGLTGELGELIPQTKELSREQLRSGEAVKVIARLMGGSAVNSADSLQGSFARLQNSTGTLFEEVGKKLSPSFKLLAFHIADAFDKASKWLANTGSLESKETKLNRLLEERVSLEKDYEIFGGSGLKNSLLLLNETIALLEREIELLQLRNEAEAKRKSWETIQKGVNTELVSNIEFRKQANDEEKKGLELKKVNVKTVHELQTAEQMMYASSISGLRSVIKGYLATAVAKMITKEAGKGLLGIVTASIGAIAVSSLFDQLVPAFAKGGVVTGSGGTDTINARLTAGEYVINRRSAGAIGYDKLNSLNRVGFAEGGVVGGMDLANITPSNMQTVNITGNVMTDEFYRDHLRPVMARSEGMNLA